MTLATSSRFVMHAVCQRRETMAPSKSRAQVDQTLLDRECFEPAFLIFEFQAAAGRARQCIVDASAVCYDRCWNASGVDRPLANFNGPDERFIKGRSDIGHFVVDISNRLQFHR